MTDEKFIPANTGLTAYFCGDTLDSYPVVGFRDDAPVILLPDARITTVSAVGSEFIGVTDRSEDLALWLARALLDLRKEAS